MLSWKFGNKRVSFFLVSLKEETRKGSYIRIGFFSFEERRHFLREKERVQKKYGEQKGKREVGWVQHVRKKSLRLKNS